MVSNEQDVKVEPTQPPDPTIRVGPGANGVPGKPPTGYLPLPASEKSATIGKIASSLLGGEWGALTPFSISGKRYMARVEPHFHPIPPPGTPPGELKKFPKPWGWHKGVTVYKAASAKAEEKPTASETEYSPDKPVSGRVQLLQRIDNFLTQFGDKG